MLRSNNKKLYNITNYILKNTNQPILFNPFGIHYKIDNNIIYNKDLEESINKQSGYIVKNIILYIIHHFFIKIIIYIILYCMILCGRLNL